VAAEDELAGLDTTDLAELLEQGRVAPELPVELACARIRALDERLGAVPIRLFEQARAQLRDPATRKPLTGIPFLLKDVGARQRGLPDYAANRALRAVDHRALADTPLGARFREVGLVTLGKSNAPEFGMQSNTWPRVYGPTRNPWNLAHTAGGSSGGACAAVCAGLVSVAHASDGAGSIRIPAAWCGLIGLKPTRDRVVWRHAGSGRPDVEFVVARSLRDTAWLLDLLRPSQDRRRSPKRYRDALTKPPGQLRAGVCTDSPAGSPVHEDYARATRRIAEQLGEAGVEVREVRPEALEEYAERALWGTVLGPQGYRECIEGLEARLGRPVEESDVEPFLWQLAQLTPDAPAPGHKGQVEAARAWNRDWEQRLRDWFDTYDLLVTPTVHEPAPLLHEMDPRRLDTFELLERMAPHMAFTEPWNATGQPAISLPVGFTAAGLPIGVQLVAGLGRDDLLIQVASMLLGFR